MNGCKLKKIENLKVPKKLVSISLQGNLIEDPSI